VICIENPRAPGSIPGRGTIIQKALHENAGLFCISAVEKHRHTLTCPCGCAARCNPGSRHHHFSPCRNAWLFCFRFMSFL